MSIVRFLDKIDGFITVPLCYKLEHYPKQVNLCLIKAWCHMWVTLAVSNHYLTLCWFIPITLLEDILAIIHLLFSCNQAALLLVQSVHLSVHLSVCHTLFFMFSSSYHHEIVRSNYQWQKWCPCKRSEIKVQCDRGQKPNLAVSEP